jgi:hypothetical protein
LSSILNALKKLENEMAQQSSLLKEIDPKKTIRRKTIGTWIFYSLISALFTAAILIGGGWLVLQQKPALMKLLVSAEEKKSEKPSPPIAAKKQEPLPRKPELIAQTTPEPVKPQILPAIKPLPEKPAVPEIKEEIIRPSPIIRSLDPKPAPIREESLPDSPEIKEIEQEIEQAIQETAAKTDTPLPVPDKADSVPEKQVEGLTIQALVWSEDPKRCMVVINSQILHTGDMVNGFQIKEIGNDFVMFQQGENRLKMKFQVR